MDQNELRARKVGVQHSAHEDRGPVGRVSSVLVVRDGDVESLEENQHRGSPKEFKGRHIQMMALCMPELELLLTM
jgi:hypothetical protein